MQLQLHWLLNSFQVLSLSLYSIHTLCFMNQCYISNFTVCVYFSIPVELFNTAEFTSNHYITETSLIFVSPPGILLYSYIFKIWNILHILQSTATFCVVFLSSSASKHPLLLYDFILSYLYFSISTEDLFNISTNYLYYEL